MENITLDYTIIKWLIVSAKAYLLDINVLIFRMGEIFFLIFYRKLLYKNKTKEDIYHYKGLIIYYLLILSDVVKFTSVEKYSSDVSF